MGKVRTACGRYWGGNTRHTWNGWGGVTRFGWLWMIRFGADIHEVLVEIMKNLEHSAGESHWRVKPVSDMVRWRFRSVVANGGSVDYWWSVKSKRLVTAILGHFWAQNERWSWGVKQEHSSFSGELMCMNWTALGAVLKEGNAHQPNQMGLAVREVTAAPGIFPDYPHSAGASGMGGSFSLPECQGTPVWLYKAVIGTWTHQAWEDQGVSNTTVIFRSLEKLTVWRTETTLCWQQQWL